MRAMSAVPASTSAARGQSVAAARPVHLLTPSVRHAHVAKGGTNFYRSMALIARAVGPTTCYELAAAPNGVAWRADGIEVRAFPGPDALLADLRSRQSADAVIVKFTGALGVNDWAADLEVGRIAQDTGARAVYFDPDAPSRLPLLVGARHHLFAALPSYAAVLLSAGGVRAATEYGSFAPVDVHHVSAAFTATAVTDAAQPLRPPSDERAYDLTLTVSAFSHREERLVPVLSTWLRQRSELRLALVGHWPRDIADRPGVSLLSFADPRELQGVYSRSRFAANLLRGDFAGYSDTAAARIFEAPVGGACLVTEPFPGLSNYLEPELECVPLRSLDDLPAVVAMPDRRRREMTARARERIAAESAAAARQIVALLTAL
jgi:hypothetical protein